MSHSSPAPHRPRRDHDATPPPVLLPPVSLLHCLVFCVCLAPQLLLQAGIRATFASILQALPFLVLQMPLDVAHRQLAGWRRGRAEQQQQQQRPSLFEEVVLCCVRWAFIHTDPHVGRVFFSRSVALPFHRFRQLQALGAGRLVRAALSHALSFTTFLLPPFAASLMPWPRPRPVSILRWREHHDEHFRGMWITYDASRPPDIVLFFVHGGGFVLGSSHFYLEFLLAWAALLMEGSPGDEKPAGFRNPAIFSLDYTLAPDAVFPTQIDEAAHAYAHVLSTAAQGDPARIVVAGDSAGGTIVLSLLLRLSQTPPLERPPPPPLPLPLPGMAVLISPWVTLRSQRYRRSANDYIDAETLASYAALYEGKTAGAPGISGEDPVLSPGHCRDSKWWRRACPAKGIFATYGAEEVFAPEIRAWVDRLQADGVDVQTSVDDGGLGVHAWPVASLFLARSNARRFEGLRRVVGEVKRRMR
ncbi:uncharacterized protein SPSK_09131 [Sporothrix schenckii 1099-18]|uniref:Alpha/beta hydrolase fold-3 domain-containing protein n=1 Tax=Sporothrix schenckii 1099-18 TaxID=1397361 RepID=A0A0F2M826_SPOSC|nr:uncharacterized protein SPSK_09131 [Sporothrix schenckii 1099-18]KJR85848.1 hypothetical protein SPSK_09131 [Sporothrix schenckii 1099-18]